MNNNHDTLDKIIDENRNSNGPALPSVCSAHPDVLAASLLLAQELNRPLLIEATSNQVNHRGGYTGKKPAEFIKTVISQAEGLNVSTDRLLFGGDHLGPQVWKTQNVEAAMAEAEAMITSYVKAGFTKIHLDCSEGCAGEPPALSDGPAAARAAKLAKIAEAAAADPTSLRYVIGTEVPPPGGARHDDEGIAATPPERAQETLNAHAKAFAAEGMEEAFTRVRGLVVQPGLEFAPNHIDRFDMNGSDHLSSVLSSYPKLCFEAHSTDYQHAEIFPELAHRNFAILKVGPALTFAWREALYAISHVDVWENGTEHISDVMEDLMNKQPENWESHYHGEEQHRKLMRHFGYADRIRYYWTKNTAISAVAAIKSRFDSLSHPAPLLSQYLPQDTIERAKQLDLPPATSILVAHVQTALRPYFTKPN